MKLHRYFLGVIFNVLPIAAFAQYAGQNEALIEKNVCVPLKALAFDYADVRLLDGPFKKAMEIEQHWLKEADVNRFLHNFRVTAGLATNAQAFGGWESLDCELRGHSLGHLLSGLALMYASTQDKQYCEKGAMLVKGLAECQHVLNQRGYLSAFPEYFIDRAIKGETVWAPWYTLHKLYAGLFDQYVLCENKLAYEVLLKMCDWAYEKVILLDDETLQKMLLSEFGGMSEVFYNVYALTGDSHHKKLAELFYHKQILNPLAEQEDSLAGLHVNTQIPKVIGEARGYELTGNAKSRDIASFFWDVVVNHHSYVTGGNSDYEVFAEPDKLADHLSENTTETCNTYNMLKLTRHLFTWNALPVYADYYERALYNHILSSQDRRTGGVTYYHTLHPGSGKTFQYPFQDNTCCVGTGYENHAKYGEAIYYRTSDNKGIYVNLFISSVLHWKAKKVILRQETIYPDESFTCLVFDQIPVGEIRFPVYLRYPSWAVNGIMVKVNGKKQKVRQNPGSYICLDRVWKQGDIVTMEMPMTLHIEYMPDNSKKGAIMYGPIVLAAELGKKIKGKKSVEVPILTGTPKHPSEWLKTVEGKPLSFYTTATGQGQKLILSPLFRNNDQYYTVYFDFDNNLIKK